LASQLFDTDLEENTSKQITKAAEDTHSCVTDKKPTCLRSRFKKNTSPTNEVHHGLPLSQPEFASWEDQVILGFRDGFKAHQASSRGAHKTHLFIPLLIQINF